MPRTTESRRLQSSVVSGEDPKFPGVRLGRASVRGISLVENSHLLEECTLHAVPGGLIPQTLKSACDAVP